MIKDIVINGEVKEEKTNLFSLRLVERVDLGLRDDALNGREIIFFLATFHRSLC